ncbi:MAG: DUF559 domain-containing protein [Euzebya sp.]
MDHLHGVTTAQALLDEGLTADRLSRLPEFDRLARGYYALPGARRDFWFQAAAAQMIAGSDSRLTSGSCLFALGALDRQPRPVEVVVPEGKGSRKQRGFDVRRSSHLPSDVTVRHGIRLVHPSYAVGDYARKASDSNVAFAISQILARRLATLDSIANMAELRGSFPGSARLRRVLRDFDGEATHSRRERVLRRELRKLGVVLHPEPLDITDESGLTVGQADIAILDVRLDVEVDGPHHLIPAQQFADRKRDRGLKVLDWDVVRFLIYEIDEDPVRVAREIADLVNRLRERKQAAAA